MPSEKNQSAFQSSLYALAASLGLGVASLASFNPSTAQTMMAAPQDISALWMGAPVQATEVEAEDALISAARSRRPSSTSVAKSVVRPAIEAMDALALFIEDQQNPDFPGAPFIRLHRSNSPTDVVDMVTGNVGSNGRLCNRAPFPKSSPLFQRATLRSEVAPSARLSVDIVPAVHSDLEPHNMAVLLKVLQRRFNSHVESLPASDPVAALRPSATTLRDDFTRRAHGIRIALGNSGVNTAACWEVGARLRETLLNCAKDIQSIKKSALAAEREEAKWLFDNAAQKMNLTVVGTDHSSEAAVDGIRELIPQHFHHLKIAIQTCRLDFYCQAPSRKEAESLSESFANGLGRLNSKLGKAPTLEVVDWEKVPSHMRFREPNVKVPTALIWLGRDAQLALATHLGWGGVSDISEMIVGGDVFVQINPHNLRNPSDLTTLRPQQLLDQLASRLFERTPKEVKHIMDSKFLRASGYLFKASPTDMETWRKMMSSAFPAGLGMQNMVTFGNRLQNGKVIIIEPKTDASAPEGYALSDINTFRNQAPVREVPILRTGDLPLPLEDVEDIEKEEGEDEEDLDY